MRLLLIPHIALRNVKGDSNYLLFLDLAKYMISRGHFCYMLMPGFVRKAVERMPGLMYVWQDGDKYDFYTNYHIFDPQRLIDLFSRRAGSEIIDAVITSKGPFIPLLKGWLSDFTKAMDIVCVFIEPYVFIREDGDIYKGTMTAALSALGYVYGNPVFNTEYEKERGIAMAKRYLSAHCIRKIEEDSIVQSVGVDCDYIDDITKDVEKSKKFTLFYGGRLSTPKNADKIIEVYDYFYRHGRPVDIIISTNTDQTSFDAIKVKNILEGRPQINIHYKVSRDDYLKLAKQSHVFICWSFIEGFPVGFWEQLYLGLIGLFVNRKWSSKQLPDGYPWIFSNKTEAYAMLMDIYDNYEQRKTELEWLPGYIRERYGINKVCEYIENRLIEKLGSPKNYCPVGGSLGRLIDHLLLFFEDRPFSLPQLLEIMEREGNSFTKNGRRRGKGVRYYTNYDIYRYVLDKGYRDLHNSNVPVFVKPEG